MSTIGNTKSRPWLATALATGVAALLMLVIPISYQRTTGHDVKVAISGPGLGAEGIAAIARGMKAALAAQHVTVEAQPSASGLLFVLDASIPARGGIEANALANAFVASLKVRGLEAIATVTPIREQVSGNVYAYARDQVIRIDSKGKTAAQLQAEIQQKLAEAGVPNAEVSVTKTEGEHPKTEIRIKAQHEEHGAAIREEHAFPQLMFDGGTPHGAKTAEVRIQKEKGPNGPALVVDIHQGDKNVQARIEHPETLSDAALASQIQAQLDRAGIKVKVTVTNGQIGVETVGDK